MSKSILQEKAMLVTLTIRRMGNVKVDREATQTTHQHYIACADAGEYRKFLFSNDVLSPITSIDTQARKYHYKHTSPWLDDGTRMLASKHFFEYTNGMRDFRFKREAAVQNFLDNYTRYAMDSTQRLGGIYKANDYPSLNKIARKFDFKINVRPVPQAEDFRVDLGQAELERIQNEIAEDNLRAQTVLMQDLWRRLYEAIKPIVDRFTDPDQTFRVSTSTGQAAIVDNLIDIVQLLPEMNIMEDPQINDMCREIEAKLCKVDPYILRTVPSARADIAAEANKIFEQVSGLMSNLSG